MSTPSKQCYRCEGLFAQARSLSKASTERLFLHLCYTEGPSSRSPASRGDSCPWLTLCWVTTSSQHQHLVGGLPALLLPFQPSESSRKTRNSQSQYPAGLRTSGGSPLFAMYTRWRCSLIIEPGPQTRLNLTSEERALLIVLAQTYCSPLILFPFILIKSYSPRTAEYKSIKYAPI